ncbi:hypothetical protein B0H14DRAFT_2649162 [Mycena olivaceomarginata]|nr:hypothetical protein B0H14DRAFT_2649162 [Mycena olivaceomarginata]
MCLESCAPSLLVYFVRGTFQVELCVQSARKRRGIPRAQWPMHARIQALRSEKGLQELDAIADIKVVECGKDLEIEFASGGSGKGSEPRMRRLPPRSSLLDAYGNDQRSADLRLTHLIPTTIAINLDSRAEHWQNIVMIFLSRIPNRDVEFRMFQVMGSCASFAVAHQELTLRPSAVLLIRRPKKMSRANIGFFRHFNRVDRLE